jgi:hypothetical protein
MENRGYSRFGEKDWKLGRGKAASKAAGKAGAEASGNLVKGENAAKFVEKDAMKLAGKAGGKALIASAAAAVAVVASVALAGAAVKAAADYYNRHDIAAQKAAESASRLTASYNELKEAESAFRNNINGYNDAVNGLDSLTKGTTAYKEAVMEANAKALELLKTNNKL